MQSVKDCEIPNDEGKMTNSVAAFAASLFDIRH